MKQTLIILWICLSMQGKGQQLAEKPNNNDSKFIVGANLGINCSYTDQAYNFGVTASFNTDYLIKKGFYIQIAPRYTWLTKWNEHYVTLPLHIRKQLITNFSLFAGPCITWDVSNFYDIGISGGVQYHINKQSSLILSFFTFTLFEYCIDYKYVPIGISYNYKIFSK